MYKISNSHLLGEVNFKKFHGKTHEISFGKSFTTLLDNTKLNLEDTRIDLENV